MERERIMPDGGTGPGPETGGIPPTEAAAARPAEERRAATPHVDIEDEETIDPYTGRREVDPRLLPWEIVERYSPLPEKPGFKSVRIFDQMQRQMWVYWPKDAEVARKRTRALLSRIELEKGSLSQQITTEYTRINSILGSLKGEEIPLGETDEEKRAYSEAKNMQDEAKNMLEEVEARMIFREISLQYENSSDLNVVIKAAQEKLQPEHFTAIYGMKQISPKTETEFNPFIQALQYYEEHGEEFTVFSAFENRPLFAAKVQGHLVKEFGGKPEDYAAAQLLAERMFRFTCRAVMFDSLVDKGIMVFTEKKKDKDGKDVWVAESKWSIYQKRQIAEYRKYKKDLEDAVENKTPLPELPVLEPIPEELRITDDYYEGKKLNGAVYYVTDPDGKQHKREVKFDWIGGGDGCDYDTRRTMKQRDLVIKEQATIHAHVQLINKVDCYGGDFFTRNEGVASLFEKESGFIKYGVPGMEWLDRKDHNAGGKVGRVDFKKLEGRDFSPMGRGLMGLWASRCVQGAEGVRDALTKTSESYLRNPTVESLRKLMDAFAFSKKNQDEAKEALAVDFIDFAQTTREERTGKPKYNNAEIVSMANDLAGLTDPNKPPFFTLDTRKKVLEKALGRYWRVANLASTVKDGIIGFILGVLGHIFKQGFSDIGR
ncbi:MAG: hypothetical protein WCV81_00070 [Microgenomates group bacterium]|jgi:hypothetical protein